MRQHEARLRNLHDAIVARLRGSTLRDRFSVGFNPETLRWVISFQSLSDAEFDVISDMPFRLGSNSVQWDIAENSEGGHKTLRVGRLTDTQAREFVSAVAARFRGRA
jgi:hypothetical protein